MARAPKKTTSKTKPKNPNPKLSVAARVRRQRVDVARKRYTRQEQRYRDLAGKSKGKDKGIYEQAANEMASRADSLRGVNVRKKLDASINDLVKDSKNYLVSANQSEWQRGETLGKLRLSGTNLGHRFYALTSSLWEGVGYSGRLGDDRRLNAIRKALGKDPEVRKKYGRRPNASQMIEIVEGMLNENIDEDKPYQPGTSPDDIQLMRGMSKILQQYG